MNSKDKLWRGLAYGGEFRVFAVEATQTVQDLRDLHDLSPVNTLLMGKMACAAAMLGLELKHSESEVTLRIDGQGALKSALVICDSKGRIRGYSSNPQLMLEPNDENFHPIKNLSPGTLSVIITTPGQSPVAGYTDLRPGEFARNLAHYFEQSAQIPSAVDLGVMIDREANIRAAGGFIIQQMPDADPNNADQIMGSLKQTPNVSDLMDMGLSVPDILHRFVFEQTDLSLEEVGGVSLACNCSKQRFARALRLLSEEDLEDISSGVDPQCQFCNSSYHFTSEEISAILREKRAIR